MRQAARRSPDKHLRAVPTSHFALNGAISLTNFTPAHYAGVFSCQLAIHSDRRICRIIGAFFDDLAIIKLTEHPNL